MQFSDGDTELETPISIDSDTGGVNVGSDTSPTSNYLYIPFIHCATNNKNPEWMSINGD